MHVSPRFVSVLRSPTERGYRARMRLDIVRRFFALPSPRRCAPTIAGSWTEVHADLSQLQAKIRTTTLTAVVVLGRHFDVLERLGSRKMTGDGSRMER